MINDPKATRECLEKANLIVLDDFRPHTNTDMTCPICGKNWIGTHPSTCTELECPKCHNMIPIVAITFYKGKGNHGVSELERMVEERNEWIYRARLKEQNK
jgi:hypothetical protein